MLEPVSPTANRPEEAVLWVRPLPKLASESYRFLEVPDWRPRLRTGLFFADLIDNFVLNFYRFFFSFFRCED